MVDFDELKDKAKELASDERIDAVAGKLKDLAPDSLDAKIDAVADKAKNLND